MDFDTLNLVSKSILASSRQGLMIWAQNLTKRETYQQIIGPTRNIVKAHAIGL